MPESKATTASNAEPQSTQHPSPLGTLWSSWTQNGLFRLSWQAPGHEYPISTATLADQNASILDALLNDYFQGKKVTWNDIMLDRSGWTPFMERVYQHCQAIPYGNTVTYKELATLAGNAKASRAVGAAMSRNRVLLVIPCHRVITTDGQLRGYSAKGGINTKHRLLELERLGHWPQDLFANE